MRDKRASPCDGSSGASVLVEPGTTFCHHPLVPYGPMSGSRGGNKPTPLLPLPRAEVTRTLPHVAYRARSCLAAANLSGPITRALVGHGFT